jgi:hypothetical protein
MTECFRPNCEHDAIFKVVGMQTQDELLSCYAHKETGEYAILVKGNIGVAVLALQELPKPE